MNQKGFVNIILILAIVAILGIVGYFALFKKSQISEQPTTQFSGNGISNSKNQVEALKDWLTYSNPELGITFRYPTKLGKIDFSSYAGDTGRAFSASSENYIFRFGGLTKDFSVGREGNEFGVSGFSKEGKDYYVLSTKDSVKSKLPYRCKEFVKEINTVNTVGIILRGLNPPEEDGYYPCPGTKYGAVFNLKSAVYSGIIFWVYDDTKLSQQEFEGILRTLEIKN